MPIALSGSGSINANAPRYSLVGRLSMGEPARFELTDNANGLFMLNGAEVVSNWTTRVMPSTYVIAVRGRKASGGNESEAFEIVLTDSTSIVLPEEAPAGDSMREVGRRHAQDDTEERGA